ncbi:MAG: hypothetical protein AUG06_05485 [Actinobacteria bacterium 13_1_20CM_2_65_11]|nr:MAG: hypothetical protein AUG06_05485 [Actinobacteria bacterium 13_1_20CM_2_65_11]
MVDAGVLQRLDDAEVCVGQRHILADDRDRNRRPRVLDPIDELYPGAGFRRVDSLVELEMPGHHLAEA